MVGVGTKVIVADMLDERDRETAKNLRNV